MAKDELAVFNCHTYPALGACSIQEKVEKQTRRALDKPIVKA